MKTIKFLLGITFAFSTLFLFDRCTGTTEKGGIDTTGTDAKATVERGTSDTLKAEGCDFVDGECNNTERYGTQTDGGGKEISPEAGKVMVTDFYNEHDGRIIKGGFISKEALDAIFCNHQEFNGLYCYISGKAGEEKIVIEGFHAVDASGNTPTKVVYDSSIPAADRYKVFLTQTLCPTMCGSCGE